MNLPLGYRYATAFAGIRKVQKPDIALIVSDVPAQAAAVFTQNMVKAAPVRLAQKNLQSSKGKVKAVLINAGNANCATRTGDKVARESCRVAAKLLGTKPQWVFPASTGVIGVELDINLLTNALPGLQRSLSPDGFQAVAGAIMTTDTRPKMAFGEVLTSKGVIRVAGLTKGAGMIHPNMATTLAFILTDAAVPARWLRETLSLATEHSFNSLTVDGDMSTNDTLALLANGASGIEPDRKARPELARVIASIAESLAKQIAADGEGARKLMIVRVEGFANDAEARKVAGAIANSPLVKTAVAGSDPNWGRIISAAGYAGVVFDPSQVSIVLQDVLVCQSGLAAPFDEADLKRKLDEAEIDIHLRLAGRGKGRSRVFSCDLTEGYIEINGSYRT